MTVRRLTAVDAQMLWLSAATPNDQFLLYGFDAPVDAVAALAAERGIAVVAVCGVDKLDDTGHAELGVRQSYSLTDFASDLDDAMTNGAALLETIGARLATDQLAG